MRNSKNLWEGLVSVIGRAGRGLWSLALGFHRESRALSSVLSDPVSGVKGGCDQVKRSPLAAKAATVLLLLTDRLKCLRDNCAVPQGTRPYFPPQPAFPRWAIVVSPCGLRSWYLPNSRLPPQVRKLSSHADSQGRPLRTPGSIRVSLVLQKSPPAPPPPEAPPPK